jgi:hypothetical protein
MQSKRFTLNKADIEAQVKSAFIFLAPSFLAFIVALSPAISSLKADTPTKVLIIVLVKWGLDQLTGLLRRSVAGK